MVSRKTSVLIVVAVLVVVVAVTTAVVTNWVANPDRTATFDQNYEGSENITITVSNGGTVVSPAVTREGYNLVGWYLDKELTEYASFPYKMNADTKFYARWSQSAASVIFNEDYLTATASGIALYNKSQTTTGAELAKMDGQEFNSDIKEYGGSYFIIDKNSKDNLLSVISMDDYSVLFTIPSDPIDIDTVELERFNTELIIAQYYSGYYMYDLSGNSFGPSNVCPEIIVADSVLFNGTIYRPDSEGNLAAAFKVTADTHFPDGGNGDTYYEIVKMDVLGKVYDYAVNILNDKFEVIKTIKLEDKAQLANVVTLPYGGYLVQYGVAGTSSEKYTVKYQGVSYILTSYLLNKDLKISEINMKKLIISSFDKLNAPFIKWDMYSNDTVSLSYIQSAYSDYGIHDLVRFSSNGKTITYVNKIGLALCSSVIPLPVDLMYKVVVTPELLTENDYIQIMDGNGKTFNVTVSNIGNNNGIKYFIKKAADEASRTDFNIYDVTGKTVGDFTGYTYIGSSHNDLFFEKSGATYVFRDGNLSKLIDGTGVKICDWGYSYSETYDDGGVIKTRYVFCTENGTVIGKSNNQHALAYLSDSGEYYININVSPGEFRLYKLTV